MSITSAQQDMQMVEVRQPAVEPEVGKHVHNAVLITSRAAAGRI
jgi:hypothetical protein